MDPYEHGPANDNWRNWMERPVEWRHWPFYLAFAIASVGFVPVLVWLAKMLTGLHPPDRQAHLGSDP